LDSAEDSPENPENSSVGDSAEDSVENPECSVEAAPVGCISVVPLDWGVVLPAVLSTDLPVDCRVALLVVFMVCGVLVAWLMGVLVIFVIWTVN